MFCPGCVLSSLPWNNGFTFLHLLDPFHLLILQMSVRAQNVHSVKYRLSHDPDRPFLHRDYSLLGGKGKVNKEFQYSLINAIVSTGFRGL